MKTIPVLLFIALTKIFPSALTRVAKSICLELISLRREV